MNQDQNYNIPENENSFTISQTVSEPESFGPEQSPPRFHYKKPKRPSDPEPSQNEIWRATPVRRVGTLTMGVSLVLAGVVALLCTFNPGIDLSLILRLSPVIFIMLGAEVLIGSLRHKGERIKFDFMSGFVCLILICGAGCLAAAGALWQYINPKALMSKDQYRYQVMEELETAAYNLGNVSSASINVDLPNYILLDDFSDPLATAASVRVYSNISLKGPYSNQEAFAKDCLEVIQAMGESPYRLTNFHISWYGRTETNPESQTGYWLDLYRPSTRNLTLDAILSEVQSERTSFAVSDADLPLSETGAGYESPSQEQPDQAFAETVENNEDSQEMSSSQELPAA